MITWGMHFIHFGAQTCILSVKRELTGDLYHLSQFIEKDTGARQLVGDYVGFSGQNHNSSLLCCPLQNL